LLAVSGKVVDFCYKPLNRQLHRAISVSRFISHLKDVKEGSKIASLLEVLKSFWVKDVGSSKSV
jgi:hypothetical protein